MRKTVKIGSHDIELEANGATPIRFRNLFHRDLLKDVQAASSDAGFDVEIAANLAPELAYLMAMTAEKADLTTLSEEKYLVWLEQFDALDLINAVEGIFSVYFGDAATQVDSKKKAKGAPSGS